MLLIIKENSIFVNDYNAVNIRISVNLFETFHLKISILVIDTHTYRWYHFQGDTNEKQNLVSDSRNFMRDIGRNTVGMYRDFYQTVFSLAHINADCYRKITSDHLHSFSDTSRFQKRFT